MPKITDYSSEAVYLMNQNSYAHTQKYRQYKMTVNYYLYLISYKNFIIPNQDII